MRSLVGALLLTFFLSRAIRVVVPLRDPLQLAFAANLLSLTLLIAFTGLIKAYFVTFAWRQATVYIMPQLLWFLYDVTRSVPMFRRKQ
jgi:hypothetical protein